MGETPAQQIISSVRKNSIAHRERQQAQAQQNAGGTTSPKYAGSALPSSPRMNPVGAGGNKPPMQRIASGPDSYPPPGQPQAQMPMQPQHAASLPPSGGPGGPGGGAPAQQRAHPNAPRYGLSDPGPASSPSRGNSIPQPGSGDEDGGAGGGGMGGGAGQGGQGMGGPQRRQPAQKGPATFEEMGFKSQKLEEKECVVM